MKFLRASFILVILVSFTSPVFACEPIVPLAYIFSGTLFAAGSLLILGGAVLIKALAFIFFEKRLPWYQAMLWMIIANVFSSLIGFGLSLSAAIPTLLIGALPFVYVISLFPAKRLALYRPEWSLKGWKCRAFAAVVTGLFLATWVLFGLAQGVIWNNSSLVKYWILKFLYIYSALLVSIALTTLWEEWVISKLVPPSLKNTSFLLPVLKANLITLFVVMVYAAIMILPERLQSGDFLVYLLKIFQRV